jgi:hypothetical protein
MFSTVTKTTEPLSAPTKSSNIAILTGPDSVRNTQESHVVLEKGARVHKQARGDSARSVGMDQGEYCSGF